MIRKIDTYFLCVCTVFIHQRQTMKKSEVTPVLTAALVDKLSQAVEKITLPDSPVTAVTNDMTDPISTASAPIESVTADIDDELDDAASLAKKTLVLIDFNGMLVFKDKTKSLSSTLPSFVGGTGKGMAKFYLRPGAMELIARLANDSRCAFAVYTSMQKHNIRPFLRAFDIMQKNCEATFRPFHCGDSVISTNSSLEASMCALFDQPYNTPDPQPGDAYGFKRNLNAVWADRAMVAAGFNASNTLLVEGETVKARDFTSNTISPPEFTALDVASANGGGNEVMVELGERLDKVFARMQKDGATIPKVLKETQ